MRILGDVTVIVIVHEGMAIDGVAESQRCHCEKQADNEIPLLRLRGFAESFRGIQLLDLTTEDTEDTEAFCTSISVITSGIADVKGISPQRTRRRHRQ